MRCKRLGWVILIMCLINGLVNTAFAYGPSPWVYPVWKNIQMHTRFSAPVYPISVVYYGAETLHQGVNVIDIEEKFVAKINIAKIIVITEKETPVTFVVSVPKYVDVELPKQTELYRFVELKFISLDPAKTKSKIIFRVDKEFAKDGEVKLLRLMGDEWNVVDIKLLYDDECYYYYESEQMDNLILLAIVKLKKAPTLIPTPIPTQPSAST